MTDPRVNDPRVTEALRFALEVQTSPTLDELRQLGLPSHDRSAQQIRNVAKQALIRLEGATASYTEAERNQAANFIKQAARDLLARSQTEPTVPRPAASNPPSSDNRSTSTTSPAASSPKSSGQTSAPTGAPVKLVARVVAPAPATTNHTAPTANNPDEILTPPELGPIAGATRKRKRGASTAWLGWAMLGALLLLAGTAVGTVVWLRDEPWLTFESSPKPVDDPRTDLQANPPKRTGPATPPVAQTPPVANDPTAPPTTPETVDMVPPNEPSPNTTSIADPPPSTSDVVLDNDPDSQSSDETNSGNDSSELEAPVVDSGPIASPTEIDVTHGQRVIVLRQLDLALIAISAGQFEMADACLRQAKQLAESSGQCPSAIVLVEQLFTWRAEINAVVTARVPLLTNREELPVDDTFVSLISVDAQRMVIRAGGQRREYEADKLPWSLARSVLEVTHSENPSEDLARQLVADVLRRKDTSDEANQIRATELKALLESEWQSPTYSPAALRELLNYLEKNADLARYCPGPEIQQKMEVGEWAQLYREATNELKSNRDLRTKLQDESLNRLQLEADLWSQADTTKSTEIARTALLILQVAIEEQDLSAFLDHLPRIEQLLALTEDHLVWTELGRALAKSKSSDADLVPILKQIKNAVDDSRHGPQAINGLAKVGKQLSQRLSERTLKQEWLRAF